MFKLIYIYKKKIEIHLANKLTGKALVKSRSKQKKGGTHLCWPVCKTSDESALVYYVTLKKTLEQSSHVNKHHIYKRKQRINITNKNCLLQ